MGWRKGRPDDVRWVEHLGVTGALRDDLLAFSADPGNAATRARLAAHGWGVVEPLLTLVPLRETGVEAAGEAALAVLRVVGPGAVGPLIALLNEPIALNYDRFVGNGRARSWHVFKWALEGLAEAAADPDCPSLVSIQTFVEPWLNGTDSALANPARSAWIWANRTLAARRGDTKAMFSSELPAAGSTSMNKWDSDEANRAKRRIEEERERRERDEALRNLGAWHYFNDVNNKK